MFAFIDTPIQESIDEMDTPKIRKEEVKRVGKESPLLLAPSKLELGLKRRPSSAADQKKLKRAAERVECEIYKDLILDPVRKISN